MATLPDTPAISISDDRIWIDGCFDFSHHGHAGAMLQAKQLGNYLVVGIHTDEEILENKGPTVMTLPERIAAVDACKWSNLSVPTAPYVTSTEWLDHFGCKYVVHGDDVTTDASGEDCYRDVKAAGRFKIVKRTPDISTTDLVGRMLLYTKQHHIRDLAMKLKDTTDMMERVRMYATNESGLDIGSSVWNWEGQVIGEVHESTCKNLVHGVDPSADQRIVYVDGGFDLFSSGQIEFLRLVVEMEKKAHPNLPAPFVVAGVHDDATINVHKGLNYPIMNMYERGLCVLQCRYINAVVLTAPFAPSTQFLSSLPYGTPNAVYHGPTSFMPDTSDPYKDAKSMGIFTEVPEHKFMDVNAGTIVERIMKSRELYEERQRKKGVKAEKEITMNHD